MILGSSSCIFSKYLHIYSYFSNSMNYILSIFSLRLRYTGSDRKLLKIHTQLNRLVTLNLRMQWDLVDD